MSYIKGEMKEKKEEMKKRGRSMELVTASFTPLKPEAVKKSGERQEEEEVKKPVSLTKILFRRGGRGNGSNNVGIIAIQILAGRGLIRDGIA